MELTEELLAQLGAYVSGQMSEPERQAFATRLGQDPDLAREVRIQTELRQGLSLLAHKQRFKAMHTDLLHRGLLNQSSSEPARPSAGPTTDTVRPLPTRRPTVWPTWNYLTAAASLLLLVGMGWLFFWRQSIPTAEAIQRGKAFDSVFTPDLKAAPRPPADPDRLGAAPSIPLGSQDSLALQQGVTLLARQQIRPALDRLQPIAQGTPGHWRASAQWFLALAYLKNGQVNQTDSLLRLMTESNGHPYQLEAQRLRSQLPHASTSRP